MTATGIGPPPPDESATCPRCATPLPPGSEETVTCPGCGTPLLRAGLVELASLVAWAGWAGARADWLRDRLVAGDLPPEGWSALSHGAPAGLAGPRGASAGPPRPQPPRPAAGTLLLAGGAALLVLAGIAFVAFAWDLLGPAGQVLTLYGLGAAAMVAGGRLRVRLPGTATTLGIVGALLVAVSAVATRSLGPDLVGETAALVVALAAGAALAAVGVARRGRQAAVGEVAALAGAALVVTMAALAPVDGAVPVDEPWAWWPAVVLLAGGVLLLLMAPRLRVRSWPPLAAVALFLGSLVLAGHVTDRAGGGDATSGATTAGVLLAVAVLLVLLGHALPARPAEPRWVAAVLTAIAVMTATAAALQLPSARPWAALILVGAALLAGWAATRVPDSLAAPLTVAAATVAGMAVACAVAPWTAGWTPWRGPLAGAVFAVVAVVVPEADRRARATGWWGLAPAGSLVAGLGTWAGCVLADHPQPADTVVRGLAVALLLPGVAGWVQVARRRLPPWGSWLSGAAVVSASALLVAQADVDSRLAPEAFGLALAWGAAVSGALCGRARRPEPTPSLVTVAPALTLALAPTTWAVVVDATDRWWWGEDPGTAYQVRVALLVVVGAVLVVAGARRRLAGVVVPAAAALLVVTVVQLVELGRFLPQWASFALAGGLLVAAGARWESVRRLGRETGSWARHLR